jgi:glycerol-1-phosphatase
VPASTLLGSSSPLTRLYDVALLDLDGVVYVGPDAVSGAPGALSRARADGLRLAFVTNNAARTPAAVAEHLTELGVHAQPEEVITSAQAAAHYLSDRLPAGAAVLVVGTTGLIDALAERGLRPVDRADDDVAAVVQGYSPELNWKQLAEGAVAIRRGVPWVATNLDPTVPSQRGPLPGNGSMVAALRHATGVDPVATGKPDPTMHRETLIRTGAKSPIVVGDRLDTDIEGANAAECPSLLVFSGVTTVAELLAAGPQLRPTYVGADVGALLAAHPEPESVEDGARCRDWIAARGAKGWELRSATDRGGAGPADDVNDRGGMDESALDAVRALCAAQWTDGDPDRSDAPVVVRAARGDDAAASMVHRLGLDPS